jgi:hypothetical protein
VNEFNQPLCNTCAWRTRGTAGRINNLKDCLLAQSFKNNTSSYTIEDVIFNWTTKSNLGGQSEPVDCPTANSRQLVKTKIEQMVYLKKNFLIIAILDLVLAGEFSDML